MAGGQDAAQIGLGSLITIYGSNLSDGTGSEPGTGKYLPHEIAGTALFLASDYATFYYGQVLSPNGGAWIG